MRLWASRDNQPPAIDADEILTFDSFSMTCNRSSAEVPLRQGEQSADPWVA
jgi:hypothetical protein